MHDYRNDPIKGAERRAKHRARVKEYQRAHRDKVNEWTRRWRNRRALTITEI